MWATEKMLDDKAEDLAHSIDMVKDTLEEQSDTIRQLERKLKGNKKMDKKEFFSRMGYVKIKRDLIVSNPKLIMEMQSHMLVLDTKRDFAEDTFTFWGDSEEFELAYKGAETPEYEAIFENNHFVKFEKKGGK